MFVSCKCCSVVCGQVEVHVMGHSLIRRSPIKHGDLTDQKGLCFVELYVTLVSFYELM